MASTTTNSAATKGKGKAIAPFLSYRETIQLVQEFLETAFHTILYLRQIYPPDLFAKRKTYDTVLVYQSRHPTLNEYIGRIIEAIGEELAKGSLKKVALVIKEANLEEKPLERFVFDFGWLFASENRPAEGEDWTPKTNGLSRTDVEHNLRAFLLKLNAADSYLLPLPPPPGVTFGVVIEMNDSASAPESERARRGVRCLLSSPLLNLHLLKKESSHFFSNHTGGNNRMGSR
ncbi:DNA-binding protein [Meredithblackwellia eburnea MCA 4105]